jgi:integral membrane sensor domain MASE1
LRTANQRIFLWVSHCQIRRVSLSFGFRPRSAWATLYLGGNQLIPAIAVAHFITNFHIIIKDLTIEKALFTTLIQTIITVLTTAIGTNLLRIFVGGQILNRVRNVVVFIAIGLVIPGITPTLSLLYMGLLDIVPWELSGQVWKTWWIGDALSVIIGMPMLVSWQRFRWRQIVWNRSWDFVFLLLGFGLLSGFTFLSDYPLQYLVLPGLLWAAIRLGDCGATFGVVAVTLMIVMTTAMGRGPFLRSSLNESLVLLQTFMATIAFTTLLMLAMIAEKAKT